jgi:hypothetical protein
MSSSGSSSNINTASTSRKPTNKGRKRQRGSSGDKINITDDEKRKIAKAMEKHGSVIWKLDHPLHKKTDAISSAYRKISEDVGLDGNSFLRTIIAQARK